MARPENKYLLFLLLTAVLGCAKRSQETPEEYKAEVLESKVKEIVLVNAGEGDRCQMAELVQRISKCNPKVIGINFLFLEEKDVNCDSILRLSIFDSDKVVLVEGFKNEKHLESSKKFKEVAFLTGVTGLILNENEIADYYYRMIDYRGKWELSFPFLLALQFDKERAAELSSKLTPKDYPITFYHRLQEFEVLDFDTDFSKNLDLIEGKIVIIGYLGPAEDDTFRTPVTEKSSEKTYATVILANIVLDILKDLN